MEKHFGAYYSDKEFDDGKLPDNTEYLERNNIFSSHSEDAKKISEGETLCLLGFNIGHNSGVSLIQTSLKNGIEVIANYEEERFISVKHAAGHPGESIKELRELLHSIGKAPDDIFCILYAWDAVQEEKYGQKMILLNGKIIKNKYFAHVSAAATPVIMKNIEIKEKRENFYNHSPGLVLTCRKIISELKVEDLKPVFLPQEKIDGRRGW